MRVLLLCVIAMQLCATWCFGQTTVTSSGDGELTPFVLRIDNVAEGWGYTVTRFQDFPEQTDDLQATEETVQVHAEKSEFESDIAFAVDPRNGALTGFFVNNRGYRQVKDETTHYVINDQQQQILDRNQFVYSYAQVRNVPQYVNNVRVNDIVYRYTTKIDSTMTCSENSDAGTFTDIASTYDSRNATALEAVTAEFSYDFNANTWDFSLDRTGTAVLSYNYAKAATFVNSGNPSGDESVAVSEPSDLNNPNRPTLAVDWMYYVTSVWAFIDHISTHPFKYATSAEIYPFMPDELLPPEDYA